MKNFTILKMLQSPLFKKIVIVSLFAIINLILQGCSETRWVSYTETVKEPVKENHLVVSEGKDFYYYFKKYQKPMTIMFINKGSNKLVGKLITSKKVLENFQIISYDDAKEMANSFGFSLSNINNSVANQLSSIGVNLYSEFYNIGNNTNKLRIYNTRNNSLDITLKFKDTYYSNAIKDAVKFFETFKSSNYYYDDVIVDYQNKEVTKWKKETDEVAHTFNVILYYVYIIGGIWLIAKIVPKDKKD